MDTNLSRSNWNDQKILLRKRIRDLTENNQLFSDEKKAELMLKLEKTLGKSQEEIKRIIDEL